MSTVINNIAVIYINKHSASFIVKRCNLLQDLTHFGIRTKATNITSFDITKNITKQKELILKIRLELILVDVNKWQVLFFKVPVNFTGRFLSFFCVSCGGASFYTCLCAVVWTDHRLTYRSEKDDIHHSLCIYPLGFFGYHFSNFEMDLWTNVFMFLSIPPP